VIPVFSSQGVEELGSFILDPAEYSIVLVLGSSETTLSSFFPGCILPLIAFLV
jgi:hypothetical protein